MANTYRGYSGVGGEIDVIVASAGQSGGANPIQVGDSVHISSGEAIAAGTIADQGTAAQNMAQAAATFLGIAMALNSDGSVVTVATKGKFVLTQQAAGAANVGDRVSVYASASACSDQEWAATTTTNEIIGTVVKDITSTTDTSLIVEIFPALFGPQAL